MFVSGPGILNLELSAYVSTIFFFPRAFMFVLGPGFLNLEFSAYIRVVSIYGYIIEY